MPSSLALLLADVFPTLSTPTPDCWISKFLRRDPPAPQFERLSAAIDIVERHAQVAVLKQRLWNEHPVGKVHRPDYDAGVLSSLTKACALAWADRCQLGIPSLISNIEGMPDVKAEAEHLAYWIEAKAINRSANDRALAERMSQTGEGVIGTVSPADPGFWGKFESHYASAEKKFARCWRAVCRLFQLDEAR